VLDALAADARFSDRPARLQNQDALDLVIGGLTRGRDAFGLMYALQAAGVPAGVCQTAQDRCEHDPQLAHLGWTVELEQSEIGWWPVKETPLHYSETPTYIGGIKDRHGPSYAEDNEYVLGTILGLDQAEVDALKLEGVI